MNPSISLLVPLGTHTRTHTLVRTRSHSQIFHANSRYINAANRRPAQTYAMRANHMADMTQVLPLAVGHMSESHATFLNCIASDCWGHSFFFQIQILDRRIVHWFS
jgi:hypothetical protein